MSIQIVLVEPEIPQNTGNIARTCAATGSVLHLVKPLGFEISDRQLKRAGLDYWHLVEIRIHESLEAFLESAAGGELRLVTTKGSLRYCDASYPEGCYLLFGKETRGLPESLLRERYRDCVRIPMTEASRSLNLSNAAAVLAYEALRQQGFPGLLEAGELPGMGSV